MMPTGSGKLGQKIRTPDGDGVVTKVHNQDNVTVEMERKREDRNTKQWIPVLWVGDVSECDLFCDECAEFHSFNKHKEKAGV